MFLKREKRFSVAVEMDGRMEWVHSNNSGSMLGLTRPGSRLLLLHSDNPKRKLAWTQEAVWLADGASPEGGFWVGVDTSVPNKMVEFAFRAGLLSFAEGYTDCRREVRRKESRFDACLMGEGVPALWVECKNVTMVEDGVACFPDAVTQRGQKHLRELMDVVRCGERAAMFYLVQRQDGTCFAPADFIDPDYAGLFYEAMEAGVEMYPFRGIVTREGIVLGGLLPVAHRPDSL